MQFLDFYSPIFLFLIPDLKVRAMDSHLYIYSCWRELFSTNYFPLTISPYTMRTFAQKLSNGPTIDRI